MVRDYSCPLGRMQPKKIDPENLKKDGWRKNGILVINVDDNRLNWPEKELIKQIGNRLYKNNETRKNV